MTHNTPRYIRFAPAPKKVVSPPHNPLAVSSVLSRLQHSQHHFTLKLAVVVVLAIALFLSIVELIVVILISGF